MLAFAMLRAGRWPDTGAAGWRRVALGVLVSAPVVGALLQGPLSSTPTATAFSYLAGLPLLACFVTAMLADDAQARVLIKAWLLVALFQAVLGLAQLGHRERADQRLRRRPHPAGLDHRLVPPADAVQDVRDAGDSVLGLSSVLSHDGRPFLAPTSYRSACLRRLQPPDRCSASASGPPGSP